MHRYSILIHAARVVTRLPTLSKGNLHRRQNCRNLKLEATLLPPPNQCAPSTGAGAPQLPRSSKLSSPKRCTCRSPPNSNWREAAQHDNSGHHVGRYSSCSCQCRQGGEHSRLAAIHYPLPHCRRRNCKPVVFCDSYVTQSTTSRRWDQALSRAH